MSNIFDAYDSEFNDLHRDLSKTINELRNNTDSNQNIQTRQIDGLFSQVNDLLKQMEVELRSLDSATRKALSKKVASYKNTLSSLKSDYNSVREQSDKSTLMGGKSGEQRQRLLDTNEKLNRQNELIANATRTVMETEEVGMEITTELGKNRAKIESSQSKLHEFDGMTDVARRMLGSMQRRDTRQRWIMAFVAVMLVIAITVTVVYTQKKK